MPGIGERKATDARFERERVETRGTDGDGAAEQRSEPAFELRTDQRRTSKVPQRDKSEENAAGPTRQPVHACARKRADARNKIFEPHD